MCLSFLSLPYLYVIWPMAKLQPMERPLDLCMHVVSLVEIWFIIKPMVMCFLQGKLSVKSLPSYTLRDGRRVTLSSGKFDFWEPKASNWANSWLFSYLLRLICLSFLWYGWNPWSIYYLISLFFWARIIAWGQAIFKCGKVDKLPFYILKC